MSIPESHIGLNDKQVELNRSKFGNNSLQFSEDSILINILREILLEPMFIILLISCIVYFTVGQIKEGMIMMISILIVSGISIFQEYRSKNAILVLKKIATSKVKVIRNGFEIQILIDEIVVNDLLKLVEGEIISADGLIVLANDFSVNESILTGESFPIFKNSTANNQVYRGALVSSGSAIIQITTVGLNTMFGKIGLSLEKIDISKTPLQNQIRSFVRNMIIIGAIAFLVIVIFNYIQSSNMIDSFIKGLTVAMSIFPEEIPVAFSTFQALGAFRLLKRNSIIVKQPQYVETLGSATVICVDKTGTITQNKMSIEYVYDVVTKKSYHINFAKDIPIEIIEYAMWSSEIIPFDPMEKAIHNLYDTLITEKKSFTQIHEYPLGGVPPIMTHIFESELGDIIIAVKGAPEGILNQCDLDEEAKNKILDQSRSYAKNGFRVLGIGKSNWHEKKWPVSQQEFNFKFIGLIAFQDPPKDSITQTIKRFKDAGIVVKMITGDFPETATSIAQQINLSDNESVCTGDDILKLKASELQQKVKDVNIFARMFPEAKLKVIMALKENGQVVAMTGDGVNDAPALKAADIGIAMGNRGSEVAKSSAALIIIDDDLFHMTDAIALGRKIYDNLKKAIQYIVSIHIPIILIVVIPIMLHWKFSNLFSPVHVIFLELIMGPTCSIIYENEPMEPNTMNRPPLKLGTTFLSFSQLTISIIQGLIITSGCLGLGYYYLTNGSSENIVRTIVFTTLLFSNIFLTLINRSFIYSVFKTIKYKNILVPFITALTLALIFILIYVPFARNLFELNLISINQIMLCVVVAIISTFWIEPIKFLKRK